MGTMLKIASGWSMESKKIISERAYRTSVLPIRREPSSHNQELHIMCQAKAKVT